MLDPVEVTLALGEQAQQNDDDDQLVGENVGELATAGSIGVPINGDSLEVVIKRMAVFEGNGVHGAVVEGEECRDVDHDDGAVCDDGAENESWVANDEC